MNLLRSARDIQRITGDATLPVCSALTIEPGAIIGGSLTSRSFRLTEIPRRFRHREVWQGVEKEANRRWSTMH